MRGYDSGHPTLAPSFSARGQSRWNSKDLGSTAPDHSGSVRSDSARQPLMTQQKVACHCVAGLAPAQKNLTDAHGSGHTYVGRSKKSPNPREPAPRLRTFEAEGHAQKSPDFSPIPGIFMATSVSRDQA